VRMHTARFRLVLEHISGDLISYDWRLNVYKYDCIAKSLNR